MKSKKRGGIYFLPITKMGKISFWLVTIGFALLYIGYWVAMATGISIPPIIGWLPMLALCAGGITSIVSIIKYKDKGIFLFLSDLLGLLGILMIIGEFIFQH